jgi:hypothetical protein
VHRGVTGMLSPEINQTTVPTSYLDLIRNIFHVNSTLSVKSYIYFSHTIHFEIKFCSGKCAAPWPWGVAELSRFQDNWPIASSHKTFGVTAARPKLRPRTNVKGSEIAPPRDHNPSARKIRLNSLRLLPLITLKCKGCSAKNRCAIWSFPEDS